MQDVDLTTLWRQRDQPVGKGQGDPEIVGHVEGDAVAIAERCLFRRRQGQDRLDRLVGDDGAELRAEILRVGKGAVGVAAPAADTAFGGQRGIEMALIAVEAEAVDPAQVARCLLYTSPSPRDS